MHRIFRKSIFLVIPFLFFVSCVSIPQESVDLSRTIGLDMKQLHYSHLKLLDLYFSKTESDINELIDDVYSPMIINFVLKKELLKYQNNQPSIYTSVKEAATIGGGEKTELALKEMTDFYVAANRQIATKRIQLLTPIKNQHRIAKAQIDSSYQSIYYANSALTSFLISAKKVKNKQKESLSHLGLGEIENDLEKKIIDLSELISKVLVQAKDLDHKSDSALEELETQLQKIKDYTDKK